jgi:uncharacterized protein (TIGR04255 family)
VARLPKQVERPPLMEAVLELRFKTAQEAVADLLPGLLYGRLKHLFERSETLPFASIPRELRVKDENFRYRPTVRLSGKHHALLIGDHVLGISKSPPYTGWTAFKGLCVEVLAAAHQTELLNSLERFSFKCVNILEAAGRHPLALLNAELRLAEYAVTERGLRVRAESDHGGFINIIELGSTVSMEVGGVSRRGLMVSIDTLRTTTSEEFWGSVSTQIDAAHAVLKEIFFNLLKPSVVEELGPTWEEP